MDRDVRKWRLDRLQPTSPNPKSVSMQLVPCGVLLPDHCALHTLIDYYTPKSAHCLIIKIYKLKVKY
jgi:hypothetical protein